jgi:parvulin-like peptidyl-prolyl isomerase
VGVGLHVAAIADGAPEAPAASDEGAGEGDAGSGPEADAGAEGGGAAGAEGDAGDLSAEFDWRKAAPADEAPLVVVDGVTLRVGDYKSYLLGQYGDGYVQVFVNEYLVERAAGAQGVVATDEKLLAWIEDKVEQSKTYQELQGMDWDELRRNYRPHARMGYLIETLVKRRRTGEEGLAREYAVRFGEKRRARHILFQVRVRPEMAQDKQDEVARLALERAQNALERIRQGAEFAEVARRESEDPGSAARGGELPEFSRYEMVEGFAKAAFAMEVGQISEPIRSDYGWHVIKLLDVVAPAKPWSADVKAQLRAEATARPVDKQEINSFLDELRKAAKIERVWTPGS